MRDTTKAIERIRIEICKLWEAIADINKHQSQVEPHAEPEPEPAKEQFEVGDWVEFIDAGGRKSQGKYLSNIYHNEILVLDITCNLRVVVHTTKIIRKLSPSEVKISITLEGTVTPANYESFFLKHDNNTGQYTMIRYTDISHADASLVRELTGTKEDVKMEEES